jgi:hypothetical protein
MHLIKPSDWPTYNCFQFCVANLAGFFQADYQMVFLEELSFQYAEHQGTIGEKLGLRRNSQERRKSLLSGFHAIDFVSISGSGERLLEHIDRSVEHKPLVLGLSSYDCPWLPFSGRLNCDHYLIMLKKEEAGYRFIDQYCESKSQDILDLDFISQFGREILDFSPCGKKSLEDADYIAEIIRGVELYHHNRSLGRLQEFLRDMTDHLDLSKEVPDKDPTGSSLMMNLKYIGEDRFNLIHVLDHVEVKTKLNLRNAVEKLKMLHETYQMLRSRLIKGVFLSSGLSPASFASDLQRLYDLEAGFIADLEAIGTSRSSLPVQ